MALADSASMAISIRFSEFSSSPAIPESSFSFFLLSFLSFLSWKKEIVEALANELFN